ncbi:MAG: HAD family hydrolase [Bacillota bacterium]
MIEAFIFDMDGVIIDSEPIHFDVDMKTMHHLGASITMKQLEPYVGMTNPEMWDLIKQQYSLAQSVEEIINYQLNAKIRHLQDIEISPITGIPELIEELQIRKIPIAVASSSPRRFIEEVLSKFKIAHIFNCIVSGEEVPKGKPAPDVYIEAAKQLNVNPSKCIVLEDSRNGIAAAKAAGMRCIGYVNANSGNQDLSSADFIIQSIDEILTKDLISGNGGYELGS